VSSPIDIKPEGISEPEVKQVEKVELPQQKIAGTASLGDLSKDYVFFTPGLIFTHGELPNDPVQEFVNEAKGTPQIAFMNFDKPIFEGFRFKDGRVEWNHKLLAIERPRWEEILQFLGTVGILDREQKLFYGVKPFMVRIADPVIMDRSAVLPSPIPLVEVVVFGLDGNKRQVLVEDVPGGLSLPKVVIHRPLPKTIAYAKKLLARKNPGEFGDPETLKTFKQFEKN
jgi:hypothetical protein